MSSQYGECQFIAERLAGRVGRFLDIGAFDGKTFSNTWHLSQAGWSGVCVEPSPPAFCHLMRNYEGNANVALVNAAVTRGADARVRRFQANTPDAAAADMVSTFVPAHARKFPGFPFREIWIPTISVSELADAIGASFDFINIDVEGLNREVFADALRHLNAEMICIEIDPEDAYAEFCSRAKAAGYVGGKRIGGNLLVWRRE